MTKRDLPIEAAFLFGFLFGGLLAGGGLTVADIATVSEIACESVELPPEPDA